MLIDFCFIKTIQSFIEQSAHIKTHKRPFSLRTVLLHQSLWPGLLSTSHHFIVVQTISDGNTGGSLGKHVDFGMKSRIRNIACLIKVFSFTFLSGVLGRRKNKKCSLSCCLVFTLLVDQQKKHSTREANVGFLAFVSAERNVRILEKHFHHLEI